MLKKVKSPKQIKLYTLSGGYDEHPDCYVVKEKCFVCGKEASGLTGHVGDFYERATEPNEAFEEEWISLGRGISKDGIRMYIQSCPLRKSPECWKLSRRTLKQRIFEELKLKAVKKNGSR